MSASAAAKDPAVWRCYGEGMSRHFRIEGGAVVNYQPVKCPILYDIAPDPVLSVDGQCYDRQHIEQWFRRCSTSTSPITNTQLSSTALVSVHCLRALLQEFVRCEPGVKELMASSLEAQAEDLAAEKYLLLVDFVHRLNERDARVDCLTRDLDALHAEHDETTADLDRYIVEHGHISRRFDAEQAQNEATKACLDELIREHDQLSHRFDAERAQHEATRFDTERAQHSAAKGAVLDLKHEIKDLHHRCDAVWKRLVESDRLRTEADHKYQEDARISARVGQLARLSYRRLCGLQRELPVLLPHELSHAAVRIQTWFRSCLKMQKPVQRLKGPQRQKSKSTEAGAPAPLC